MRCPTIAQACLRACELLAYVPAILYCESRYSLSARNVDSGFVYRSSSEFLNWFANRPPILMYKKSTCATIHQCKNPTSTGTTAIKRHPYNTYEQRASTDTRCPPTPSLMHSRRYQPKCCEKPKTMQCGTLPPSINGAQEE